MSITLYGIPNCDTVKKARGWLEALRLPYHFHDYKKAGVDEERLRRWSAKEGWALLVNRRGTTFRNLPEEKRALETEDQAIALMLENPSLIRRPVVEYANDQSEGLLVGFDPVTWSTALEGELT